MNIWKPEDRDEFIRKAISSQSMRGNREGYYFNVIPKVETSSLSDEHDHRRSLLTDALARTIYTKNPKFRYLSVGYYYTLIEKIRTNVLIGDALWKDIMVVIKGANAYMYLTNDSERFPASDLDIMIYINPDLPDEKFNSIKQELRKIVLQTISQHKRLLDHMFFVNNENDFKRSEAYKQTKILSDEEIKEFKSDYINEVNKLSTNSTVILTPFQDDDIRNDCSRYGFLLKKSESHDDSIVRVEVPHFDKCENIPMRKSPFFCSYNETINFMRDGQALEGKFDLYRIRYNNIFLELDENRKPAREERVAADFIDVSISSKTDASSNGSR